MSSPTVPGRGVVAAASVLAWTLAGLVMAARWRLAPPEWPFAWPTPGAGLLVTPWPWLLMAVAVALAAAAWRRGLARERRSLLLLLLWPAVPLAVAWMAMPMAVPATPPGLWWLLPLAALGLLVQRLGPSWTPPARRPWHAGRIWRTTHLAGVGGGIVAGATLGGFGDLEAVGLSLLLYPLYGLVQLFLVLALTWPALHVVTGRRAPLAILVAAAFFALVHWPNPLIMALTGVGMALWAREYARGRPLWALAVSMGLLATLVAQGLPDAVTHHMRVGPAAARQRAVPAVTRALRAEIGPMRTGADAVGAVVAALYPPAVGRPVGDAELARWQAVVAHERRCFLAWRFLASPEAARRREGDVPPPMDGRRYWTELPPPWPARIRARADAGRSAASWRDYVVSCYEAFLDRRPSAAELAAWDADLGTRQYRSVVRAILARHHHLAEAAFDTLASEELRFWR